MRSLLLAVLFFAAPAVGAPPSLSQAQARVKSMAQAHGLTFPLKTPEIRVFKDSHQLELYSAGRLVKRYGVGLSQRGLADKRRQGDHLTPEGDFFICNRNERSQFYLFLGLSYPHEVAAARGLKEGLITKGRYDSILRALRNKSCPDWNTQLGGAVGIHGGGSSADWTWGCVALSNSEIEELWVACPPGTPVFIRDKRPNADQVEARSSAERSPEPQGTSR